MDGPYCCSMGVMTIHLFSVLPYTCTVHVHQRLRQYSLQMEISYIIL